MEDEKKIKRIALVTYNVVGDGKYDSLIKQDGLEMHLVQNGHRSKWAVDKNLSSKESTDVRERVAKRAIDAAMELSLEDMDRVYLYVGSNGAESIIAETRKMPADKITYVLCDCNLSKKRELLKQFGHPDAQVIVAECGGQRTLDKILKSYLN